MKFIAPMSGAKAIRFSLEDVVPTNRIPLQDLLNQIALKYNFMAMSEFNPQVPILFQNGKTESGVPINQLQIMQGGYIVFSSDTDTAEKIMDDMLSYMSLAHGYHYVGKIKKVSFLSAVVIEYDGTHRNVLSSLFAVENAINSRIDGGRFLKRLSFGLPDHDGGVPVQIQPTPLDAMENADFLIERRVGFGPEQNRFFCTAPMKTNDHLALLEEIERIKASDAFGSDKH